MDGATAAYAFLIGTASGVAIDDVGAARNASFASLPFRLLPQNSRGCCRLLLPIQVDHVAKPVNVMTPAILRPI
jgi:hypothetical protein